MKYGRIIIRQGNAVKLSLLRNVGIAVVTFDASDSKVNVLSSAVMEELDSVLDELKAQTHELFRGRSIYGVIFCSGKDDSFIVGADIKEIEKAQSLPAQVAFAGSQRGKAVLAKIAALPMITVAAVHGRCLGGGTELALACKERVLSNCPSTVVGLPEVALGVLPGWGGTVAAPRLIGFAAALPLVLNPMKPWSAQRCWQQGLVSEVAAPKQLFARAVCIALGAPPRKHPVTSIAAVVRRFGDLALPRRLMSVAMTQLIKLQTRGKYPAPLAALKVMNAAFEMPEADARNLESTTFAQLIHTPACAECVRKFFERKNKKSSGAAV